MENDDVNRITSLEDETERLLEKIQYLFGRIENYDDSMKQLEKRISYSENHGHEDLFEDLNGQCDWLEEQFKSEIYPVTNELELRIMDLENEARS